MKKIFSLVLVLALSLVLIAGACSKEEKEEEKPILYGSKINLFTYSLLVGTSSSYLSLKPLGMTIDNKGAGFVDYIVDNSEGKEAKIREEIDKLNESRVSDNKYSAAKRMPLYFESDSFKTEPPIAETDKEKLRVKLYFTNINHVSSDIEIVTYEKFKADMDAAKNITVRNNFTDFKTGEKVTVMGKINEKAVILKYRNLRADITELEITGGKIVCYYGGLNAEKSYDTTLVFTTTDIDNYIIFMPAEFAYWLIYVAIGAAVLLLATAAWFIIRMKLIKTK